MLEDSNQKENNQLSYLQRAGTGSKEFEVLSANQAMMRHMHRHDLYDALNSPISFRRRSFSQARENVFEDSSSVATNSPDLPTYMAATQSAKAKRSMSTPKQRLSYNDTWFNCNGEPFTRTRMRGGQHQQLSMSMN